MALHISITVRTIFCLLFLCPLPQSPQLRGRMINTALDRLTPHQLNNKPLKHVRLTTKLHFYIDDVIHFVTLSTSSYQPSTEPFLGLLGGKCGDYQELTHRGWPCDHPRPLIGQTRTSWLLIGQWGSLHHPGLRGLIRNNNRAKNQPATKCLING